MHMLPLYKGWGQETLHARRALNMYCSLTNLATNIISKNNTSQPLGVLWDTRISWALNMYLKFDHSNHHRLYLHFIRDTWKFDHSISILKSINILYRSINKHMHACRGTIILGIPI